MQAGPLLAILRENLHYTSCYMYLPTELNASHTTFTVLKFFDTIYRTSPTVKYKLQLQNA